MYIDINNNKTLKKRSAQRQRERACARCGHLHIQRQHTKTAKQAKRIDVKNGVYADLMVLVLVFLFRSVLGAHKCVLGSSVMCVSAAHRLVEPRTRDVSDPNTKSRPDIDRSSRV